MCISHIIRMTKDPSPCQEVTLGCSLLTFQARFSFCTLKHEFCFGAVYNKAPDGLRAIGRAF